MVKVSIEVHFKTARLVVAVQAQSIQRALSLIAARHPDSIARVRLPIEPEGCFVESSAA
jgi:hypothetical protein